MTNIDEVAAAGDTWGSHVRVDVDLPSGEKKPIRLFCDRCKREEQIVLTGDPDETIRRLEQFWEEHRGCPAELPPAPAADEDRPMTAEEQFTSVLKAARIVAGQMARWPSNGNASDELLVKQMNGIIRELAQVRIQPTVRPFPDLILVLMAGVFLFRATRERYFSSQMDVMTAWLELLDEMAVLVIKTYLFPLDKEPDRAIDYWIEWMRIASDVPLMVLAEEEEE